MERASMATKETNVNVIDVIQSLEKQIEALKSVLPVQSAPAEQAQAPAQPAKEQPVAKALDETAVKQLQEAARKHEKTLAKRAKERAEKERKEREAKAAQHGQDQQAARGGKAPSDVSLLARSAVRSLHASNWKPEGFTALEMANYLGVKRYIILNALYYLERSEGLVEVAGEGPKPNGVTKGLPPKLWKWAK